MYRSWSVETIELILHHLKDRMRSTLFPTDLPLLMMKSSSYNPFKIVFDISPVKGYFSFILFLIHLLFFLLLGLTDYYSS